MNKKKQYQEELLVLRDEQLLKISEDYDGEKVFIFTDKGYIFLIQQLLPPLNAALRNMERKEIIDYLSKEDPPDLATKILSTVYTNPHYSLHELSELVTKYGSPILKIIHNLSDISN